MSLGQVNNTFGVLGSGAAFRRPPVRLPAAIEPKLHIAWGEFRQSFASSVAAVFARAGTWRKFFVGPHFRDCIIERRIPRRAIVAAALWHVALFVMPFPQLPMSPRRNHAFDNVELTWSGPINDLPLLEIPAAKPKQRLHAVSEKPLPTESVDAFHPRQRIFTDPVHPTHPRQTLINPAAPPAPPTCAP